MGRNTKDLIGRVSNQEVKKSNLTDDEKKNRIGEHPDFPEVDKIRGGFSIKVKVEETDEDGETKKKVLYSRGYSDNDDNAADYSKDEEPFEYYKVPSLVSALRMEGAKLTDDKIQFMNEALAGSKETGEAVDSLLSVYNDFLKNSAQRRQYASVLNDKTPLTDETRENAMASTVRNFVKTAGVSPEIAINMLKGLNPSPLSADYTLSKFLANKGKR